MNKKGFTLVEVISVIALLGLIIGLAVPGVMRSSKKAKERTLNTKIKNIEKAAILYGQDNRNLISKLITNSDDSDIYKYCFKDDGNLINNCYYYFDDKNNSDSSDDTTLITVEDLAEAVQGKDENSNQLIGYIEYDDKENKKILNSTDESKYLNACEIQIYQKYGKIYAVYTKTKSGNDEYNKNCWIN